MIPNLQAPLPYQTFPKAEGNAQGDAYHRQGRDVREKAFGNCPNDCDVYSALRDEVGMKQHMAFLWPLIAACASLPAVAGAAWAPDRSHDSHRLSASETAEFLPVVCRRPSKTKGGVTCDSRIGTDESSSPRGASLSLNAIAYGG